MYPFIIESVTDLIVELLFSIFLKEFDTPFTRIICKWIVSKLLKLIVTYVKRKLQEYRSK